MMEDIMAIRYRKGRASPWQCYWNNPLIGKRECANFGTQHEAEKHDSLIKHRIKFDRESFRREKEEPEEKTEALTLEGAYLLYLKQKQFSKKGLEWQMDAMRYPLKCIGALPIGEISKKQLEKIKEDMLAMPIKSASVRGRLSVLRTVLRWCATQEYRSPIDFPKLPPAHYEKFIPPTADELEVIMDHAAPHIVRVIVLGAQCGVRVGPSEMFRLTWDDVDLGRRILRVHGAKKNLNAPWREVPIREGLVPTFKAWRSEDEATGISHLVHYRGCPVEKIGKAWSMALQRSGIKRRIRPYDLRHAFATELLAHEVDPGTVAKLMGHSSPGMLWAYYQHVSNDQKCDAVERLPDLTHVPIGMCPKKKALTDIL